MFGPPQLVPAAGVGDGLEDAVAAAGYDADLAVAADAVGGTLPYRPAPPAPPPPSARCCASRWRSTTRGRDPRRPARRRAGRPRRARRRHRRPATVRIAPSGGTTATFALQRLLAGVTHEVWTGDATTFARFWSARYGMTVDVEPGEDAYVVRLAGQGQGAVADADPAVRRQPRRRSGTTAPLELQGDGRRIAVPAFSDRIEIEIQAAP